MKRATLCAVALAVCAAARSTNAQNQALKCSTNPQTGYIDLPASALLAAPPGLAMGAGDLPSGGVRCSWMRRVCG